MASKFLYALVALIPFVIAEDVARRSDPCAALAGQKWVAPKDLRACFTSAKVVAAEKSNIIEVITKTLAFHTSVNYQISAPEPFTSDVHEDILGDLQRISRQSYPSDYDLHIDLSRSVKRLDDGHCVWINSCYDSLFLNFLPTPLVLLTDAKGVQTVHISPQAFAVASVEFSDEISVWQNALPGPLKGKLQSLDGAQVLSINGQDPWVAINANAAITGSFQGLGTRQNSFFSSYMLTPTGWTFIMGNFAQQSLPLADSVTLVLRLTSSNTPVTVTLPYRARIGTATTAFTDFASWRSGNCVATDATNGIDYYASDTSPAAFTPAAAKFQQTPPVQKVKKQAMNIMLDSAPLTDIALPPGVTPPSAVTGVDDVQFYMLADGKTGVLAMGSFAGGVYEVILQQLLDGLNQLKSSGATQLIVDLTNNGGGYICMAEFLHRIIVGPKPSTEPNAGLYTEARAGPLASLIAQTIAQNPNIDPDDDLLYNPINWRNSNNTFYAATDDWLAPPVKKVINGRKDAFSPRLGQECQPESFSTTPPDTPLFDGSKVAIVNNGRCASSCSLFSVTMSKLEGAKSVVFGGKNTVQQQYCGTVGGQSSDFSTIDSEIKTTHLKNNSLAPPDLIVNGVQGLTWRLGFGIDNPNEPEEWQNHPATLNLPLTAALATNPVAIWTAVAARVFH